MSTEKIVVGVLAGAAAGAILGVLFAPEKGSTTRRNIAKGSTDALHDIKHKFESLMEEISEKLHHGKEEVQDAYEKVKGKAEETFKEGKSSSIS